VAGLLTFRDYGFSWDEPLFYDYAKSLGYAYSPREWFSGNFNLENAYGSSGSDHANRGPAYILLAQPIVSGLEATGLDEASAWHLVNFLTFQLGVYLLYRLAKRWVSKTSAVIAAALFAWQPLLWGHAFINPKDPPFLVFFLGTVCFGFEMIDNLNKDGKGYWKALLSAAFFLGIATSIRVLGPLAGLLVGVYALTQLKNITLPVLVKWLAIYAAIAVAIVFATWPFLWTNPIQRFIEDFGFMSDNPTQLQVLFGSQLYRADALPRRYLPTLLGLTLTEPVWPLFLIGLFVAFWTKAKKNFLLITSYSLLLSWFVIPFAYVILRKPPMYDGYRHFLFILPPLFIFAGFAFEKLFESVKTVWVAGLISLILLAPSMFSLIQLHPYEYTYYNSLVGGTSGAFRSYETDYWLTCYKESVEQFNGTGVQLFVKREPYIAEYYADKNSISIRDYRAEFGKIQSGDFVLVNTRANEDNKTFKDAPIVLQIRRGNAVFCEIKQVP
jgi:4-amino-4-deoxy-L-arabinose transferase-like glycosyltransferase